MSIVKPIRGRYHGIVLEKYGTLFCSKGRRGGLRGDTDTDRLPLSIQPQGHNSYIFSTEAEISISATSFLQSQHSPASPTGFYNLIFFLEEAANNERQFMV